MNVTYLENSYFLRPGFALSVPFCENRMGFWDPTMVRALSLSEAQQKYPRNLIIYQDTQYLRGF
jgi:hypothetical protein